MPPDGSFKPAYQHLKKVEDISAADRESVARQKSSFAPLSIPSAKTDNSNDSAAVAPPESQETGSKATISDQPVLYGLASRLAKLMTDLTAIIAQETALLQNKQAKDAQALHGTKNRMIIEYKQTIDRLKMNQQSLGEQESDVRRYLRGLGDQLKAALKDHARIVIRLKNLTEGIIKSVGEEVAKRERPVVNYGQSANLAPSRSAKPMSLALNELI